MSLSLSHIADNAILTLCQRWVLIAFKREFPFDDVLRLWEVLWTDYYSNDFVLFVALAVLESHRDMILRYLVEVRALIEWWAASSLTKFPPVRRNLEGEKSDVHQLSKTEFNVLVLQRAQHDH